VPSVLPLSEPFPLPPSVCVPQPRSLPRIEMRSAQSKSQVFVSCTFHGSGLQSVGRMSQSCRRSEKQLYSLHMARGRSSPCNTKTSPSRQSSFRVRSETQCQVRCCTALFPRVLCHAYGRADGEGHAACKRGFLPHGRAAPRRVFVSILSTSPRCLAGMRKVTQADFPP
jgi:hypothetical protein